MVTDYVLLGIQVGGTFVATLTVVLIAFRLREGSRRKRDLRDMLYIPSREVSYEVKEQMANGEKVDLPAIDDLHRTILSRGLSREDIYEEVSRLLTRASRYNEHVHYFRMKVDQLLEEQLGARASWEGGLRVMSPHGGLQTAGSFLYHPGRYATPRIVPHWWGSFASNVKEYNH